MITRLVTTLAVWLVAFSIVRTLLELFGRQLAEMSVTGRALLLSGTLVVLMVNVVMPFIGPRIARLTRQARPTAPTRA